LLAAHHERNAKLRQLVGTSDEELPSGVSAKLDQLKDAQRTVKALEEELAAAAGRALATAAEDVVSAHWPERDLVFLQRVAKELVRLAPERVALLTAGDEGQGAFVLCVGERATMELATAGRGVAEILGGRGGGSGRIFQGKAPLSRRAEALAWLHTHR